MRVNCASILMLTVVVVISITSIIEGKRITMIPLTAQEVYRVLRETGRENAVPEGRIVTQGLAAASGFVLGIAKGIGGALLVDLITANGTQQMLGNMWSALATSPPPPQEVQQQEICFSSRSLNEINDADYDDEKSLEGRWVGTTGTGGYGANDDDDDEGYYQSARQAERYDNTNTPTSSRISDTPTYSSDSNAPSTSSVTEPTTTGTNTDTDTGTNVDTGTRSGTHTDTTTQTGTGAAVNCIVVQKPKTK